MLLANKNINIKNIVLYKICLKKYKKIENRIRRKAKKQKSKLLLLLIKILFVILILLCILLIIYKLYNKYKYIQDDLTIVSAYYKIKSKNKDEEYYDWIRNFVLLNKSIVFFTNKEFMPTIKKLRPKELYYKTVFIELEIEEFYSYKNFYNKFQESFKIDFENIYHTVPLYLIWAEKTTFLKKAILKNYFRSKCFYWIDAGYFRYENEMNKLINWPSTNKCLQDNRLLLGQIGRFSDSDIKGIINFDKNSHYNLQRKNNVIGGIFGGQKINTLKFVNLYYKALKLFIINKIFIGKDQNVFAFVAFSNPDVVKLKLCKSYYDFISYLA